MLRKICVALFHHLVYADLAFPEVLHLVKHYHLLHQRAFRKDVAYLPKLHSGHHHVSGIGMPDPEPEVVAFLELD